MVTKSYIDKQVDIVKSIILDITSESSDLNAVLIDFLSRDSKFIRTKVACLFFYDNISSVCHKILAATELIHNASLIHDDTIDSNDFRRGKPTMNKQFDNELSVIAGDFLLSQAVKLILSINNNKVTKLFFDAISKMCQGEAIQYFSKGKIPYIDEYLKKTQYKTAELFIACFESLALYSEPVLQAKEWAFNFGMAFQIKNDLDDYRLGVDLSSDIKIGVYTAPIVLLNSVEYREIAIEKTLNLIDNYCIRAKEILNNFEESEYKKTLVGIIDKLCS